MLYNRSVPFRIVKRPMELLGSILDRLQSAACKDGRPSDETPMLLDSARKRNLLANLRACRAGELQSGGIGLDSNDLGTGSG